MQTIQGIQLSDGSIAPGWTIQYDDGTVGYFDPEGNRVGSDYTGGEYYEEIPQTLPEGYGLVTDDNYEPIQTPSGQYVAAPYGDRPTGTYETGGHPAYDKASVPAFRPEAAGVPGPAGASTDGSGSSYSPSSGGNYRSYGGGGYSGGGRGSYGGSGSYSYGTGGGSAPVHPPYADGSVHPAWGGAPRTPGGFWNTGGSSDRQSTYLPNGSQSPSPGGNKAYGGNAIGGEGGGGGGGSALYNAWRSKLESKLYPGSGSGYSGSTSSTSSGGYAEYPEEKMRGKYAKKLNPEQATSLAYRPTAMIPRVAPNLPSHSPYYQEVASQDAAALGTIMNARDRIKLPKAPSSRYNASKGTYVTRPGRAGNFTSTQANAIGEYYDKAINQYDTPTFEELMKNLSVGGKKTLLGSQLANQPFGYAAQTYSNLANSAFRSSLPQDTAVAYGQELEGLIDQYGAKFMKRDPKKAPTINRWVGRRLSFA